MLSMLRILPFEESMLAKASELLEASHARARLLEPLLPPAYEKPVQLERFYWAVAA